MSARLRRALPFLIFPPVLALLIAGSIDTSERELQLAHGWLQRVAELDANLDETALELRYGLREDYDALVAIDRELQEIASRLTPRNSGPSATELTEALKLEGELVDEFKSSHAILRNSVDFLPTMLEELEASVADTRVRRQLVELERGVLRVVVSGAPGARDRVMTTLQGLNAEPALASLRTNESWKLLEGHTQAILRYEPMVRSVLAEIASVPSSTLVARSLSENEEAYRSRLEATWASRLGLVVLMTVLFAMLLRKTVDVHREARNVRETNALLEKRVEERTAELTRAEEHTRLLLESAGEGICGLDRGGKATFINPSAAHQLGYQAEDVLGRDFHALVHRQDRDGRSYASTSCPMTAVMADGEVRHVTDEVLERGNGSFFPVEYRCRPMWRDREIVGAVITFSDISERRAAEKAMEGLHRELMAAHRAAGMAEVATGVLHNVGNVLNSLMVSSGSVEESLRDSRLKGLRRAVKLLSDHRADLSRFLTEDEAGRQLIEYLERLTERLEHEHGALETESQRMQRSVSHIQDIVSRQQAYARSSALREQVKVDEVVDDALSMQLSDHHGIEIERFYDEVPPVLADKHKLLQILGNLVQNGKQAIQSLSPQARRLSVAVRHRAGSKTVRVEVRDNGVGIAPDQAPRLFEYGFTTRKDGHGFGLHSSALAAGEMGASLSFESPGLGLGAAFFLDLPLDSESRSGARR